MPQPVLAAKVGVQTLTGFRKRIGEEDLDRVTFVRAIDTPIGVEKAARLELIELAFGQLDRQTADARTLAPAERPYPRR